MAQLNFNAAEVAPREAFENLPGGWYVAQIVESEMKANSQGTGAYLQLTYEVLSPEKFANRKLWSRLNLNNPSAKAVEIAQQDLSSICHATNIIQLQDSSQLHNIPHDIKVGLSKAQEGYEQTNEIKNYRPLSGGAVGTAGGGNPSGNPAASNNPAASANPAAQAAAANPAAQSAAQVPNADPVVMNAGLATYAQHAEKGWKPEMLVEKGMAQWTAEGKAAFDAKQAAALAAQQAAAAPVPEASSAPNAGQNVAQAEWAHGQATTAATPDAPVADTPVADTPATVTVADQPATDGAAQDAAASGKAPWEV